MSQIVALIGAIALVVLVQMLRALLALPFPRVRARFVPASAPGGLGPLFDAAAQQLHALGFSGPQWLLGSRVDGEATTLPLRAVFRHADGGTAWLGAPTNIRSPHRLHAYYSHRLADGRLAVSQAFDAYFAATQTAEIVARTATETDVAGQWAAHQRWIATLGSAPVAQDDAAVLEQATTTMERQRQALLARGDLKAVSDDLAVPSLRFALMLLRSYFATPKAPPDPRPVPADRLALFAHSQEVVRHRAPPRPVQWTLFAISVALFMALGAVLWGVDTAISILIVVLIHELGHFLAMRAFGYRNVHILALPLVGGVAMGVDANPAATPRAWMSLMGPLPGIVIGWLLLLVVLSGQAPGWAAGWLLPLAMVFLFINYLNVLPIPPLDGAHVVQSLLPPRWARAHTVFIGIAATAGAYLAWDYGFHLLTALAVMQLAGLPASWRVHGAERELADDPALALAHRNTRMLHVLRKLERELGPTANAAQRVTLALGVLSRLETKPMGAVSRLLTGLVYAVLLAVPVAGLIVVPSVFTGGGLAGAAQEDPKGYEAFERQRQRYAEQARAMPLDVLVAASIAAGEERAPPATDAAVAAAEARLGRRLPDDLRQVYALANGISGVGLRPLDEIDVGAQAVDAELSEYVQTLVIDLGVGEDSWREIPIADARGWWHLGGEGDAPLFYLPRPDPRLPGVHLVSYSYEGASVHGSLREWLEARWVSVQQVSWAQADYERKAASARAALAQPSVPELLATWEAPGLMTRWMLHEAAWPDGAEAAVLAGTEAALGTRLPEDYRALLEQHDGFPPLQLLPAADIGRWRAWRVRVTDDVRAALFDGEPRAAGGMDLGGEPVAQLDEATVDDCVLAAAGGAGADTPAPRVRPRLLWCPAGSALNGWVDLGVRRRYVRFRDWLLDQAVPMAAMRLAAEPAG